MRSYSSPIWLVMIASLGGAPMFALPLAAQTAAVQSVALPGTDELKQREEELATARDQQKRAADLREKLKADIAAIGQDRGRLNEQLIETAARVRTIETAMDTAETRLGDLAGRERAVRGSLDSRRDEIAAVLAALQRAGRRAPPALLVRPEDALTSLRTAMLLGAVVPDMRGRAESLAADLTSLIDLRGGIAGERDKLTADRDRLMADQVRLASLVAERQKQQVTFEKDAVTETMRSQTLAKQVDTLQGLISKMEQSVASASKAAAAANQQGTPPALADGKPNVEGLNDQKRRSPAIAFASAKGLFKFPVNGARLRGFNESDGSGGVSKGISLASRPAAQVTTPCDAWVVYAGPFRSYGQLLILNAGGGYHVLIAGMERISVSIGQFVLTGEPVATMGSASQVASLVATNVSQPVLYVEFRKDGTSIDPGPWWAASQPEKVRG